MLKWRIFFQQRKFYLTLITQDGKIDGINFIDANLAGADFSGFDLTNCNFANANLAGANFTGANLSNAIFNGAYIAGADFTNAYIYFPAQRSDDDDLYDDDDDLYDDEPVSYTHLTLPTNREV